MTDKLYLNALGIVNCLGRGKEDVLSAMRRSSTDVLTKDHNYLSGDRTSFVGRVSEEIETIADEYSCHDSRNNQLLLSAYSEISEQIAAVIKKYGKSRVAIVIGTSTSGISEGEEALMNYHKQGTIPDDYCFGKQTMCDAAEFLSKKLGLSGLNYTVSSACSSSAKAFEVARLLFKSDLCDAAIVGGVDSLCKMTVEGFYSLNALSKDICNPFSKNRNGINIGEGAALFIMSREEGNIEFLSVGESSDAYSSVAPEPEGKGAENAMLDALKKARLPPQEINYLNLHGTGTIQNDIAESKAVIRVFGPDILCSSTKALTGHTLGAAGATEVGLCWLALNDAKDDHCEVPLHVWDGEQDNDIHLKNLNINNQKVNPSGKITFMSNSFAFGGSNASVLIARQFDE